MKKLLIFMSLGLFLGLFSPGCYDLDDIADDLNKSKKEREIGDSIAWKTILGEYGDTLNVKWKIKHNVQFEHASDGINPILLGDKLIVSSGQWQSKDYIYCIDVNTKEVLWEWGDYKGQSWGEKPHLTNHCRDHRSFLVGDRLIWPTNMGIYVIDVHTGQLLAERHTQDMSVRKRSSHIDENLVIQTYINDQEQTWVEICDPNLNCKVGYAITAPEGLSYRINQPRLVVGGTGMDRADSLLVMGIQVLDTKSNLPTEEIKMIAYNLTNRSVQWEYVVPEELMERRSQLQRKYIPLVKDGLAYLQMFDHFICLDLATGIEQWRYDFSQGGRGHGGDTDLFYEDGRLYFTQYDDQLNAMDAKTGARYWSNMNGKQVLNGWHSVDFYKDRLFMSSLRAIYVYDAVNGKGKRAYHSPSRIDYGCAFIRHFTIDKERELLYADDGHYILACEIPGMW